MRDEGINEMKHSYWISAKVAGPGGYDLTVATCITVDGVLKREQVETTIPNGFRANLGRPGAQVTVTSIFKFEDDAQEDFRAEALKAVVKAEDYLSDGTADRQLILEDLIHALRALS